MPKTGMLERQGVADGARGGRGQAVRRCLIALWLGWAVRQCTGRGGQI